METIKTIENQIKDYEEKLAVLKKEKAKFDALPEEYKLADIVHKALCRYNHADACAYLYESWDDIGTARNRELKRTRKLLAFCDGEFDKVLRLLDALID